MGGGVDPLDPSGKYATDVEINVLFGHRLPSTSAFNKNALLFADRAAACPYMLSDYYSKITLTRVMAMKHMAKTTSNTKTNGSTLTVHAQIFAVGV